MSSTPANHSAASGRDWALKLFRRSVLKQNKLRAITRLLGPTAGLRCLDIGSDNGAISYLLRERGGDWASGDLEPAAVESIRALVETDVHLLDGGRTSFRDHEFDRVVIVDYLEHIPDDAGFLAELHRILKRDGLLVINCPHRKESLLRRLRLRFGQTDERHGHLRPGYTVAGLEALARGRFRRIAARTYSRFFTECLDTVITAALGGLRGTRDEEGPASKGVLLTAPDLDRLKGAFRLYSLLYPVLWLMTRLDLLLFFRSGYCLVSSWRPAGEAD